MSAPPRFVPWSVPAAAGAVAGVALVGALPPGWAAAGVGTAVLALAWRAPPPWRLAALAVLLGAGRMAAWRFAPDPLPRLGAAERWFEGRSDGRVLRLDHPRGVRLALVADGEVATGRVRVRGSAAAAPGRRNPGGFDYAAYLRRRGVAGQLFVREVQVLRAARPLVTRFRSALTVGLEPQVAAVLAAMTLGVRDDLGPLRERFAAAGLSHVLALSGLHVGVLVAALARLAARSGRARSPLLMAATLGYVALVGPSPSVLRAATMVLVVLAADWMGMPRVPPWSALSVAALVGLAASPGELFGASMQLSYLAVIGMLVFVPPVAARWGLAHAGASTGRGGAPAGSRLRSRLRVAALALWVSIAAQLPSLSLVAGSFGRVPWCAPLVNLVAVPLAGALVPLGFVSALLGLVAPPLAGLLNRGVEPLGRLLLGIAALGARLPALPWGEVSLVGHAAFALGMAAFALALHGRLRPHRAAAVGLAAMAVTALVPPASPRPDVVFLDVGQGDATLLRLPGRADVLIDGGGTPFGDYDPGEAVVVPALRALGVRALDVVVATHADLDHVEGLLSVLERVPVGTLVMGPPDPERPIDAKLRALAARRGVEVHRARRGERWTFGRNAAKATLEVLHPGERSLGTANDDSVALLLTVAGTPQAVFLGDLSAEVEARLALPHVPVLKVAHHGSPYSTGEALLRATRPRLAIVSVGRNRYGHPAPEVLARLQRHGVRVVQTRAVGAVRVPLTRRGPLPPTVSTPPGPRGAGGL